MAICVRLKATQPDTSPCFACVQVEETVGKFLRKYHDAGGKRESVRLHTKLVPDLDVIHSQRGVDEEYVRAVLTRSCARLGVETLDLVQFHWYAFSLPLSFPLLRSLSVFVPLFPFLSFSVLLFFWRLPTRRVVGICAIDGKRA